MPHHQQPPYVSGQLLHQAPLVAGHRSQRGACAQPLGAQRHRLAPADVHVQVQGEGLAVDAGLDGAWGRGQQGRFL